MGYYTQFFGYFTISPPLSREERDRLSQLIGIELPDSQDVFRDPPAALTDEDKAIAGSGWQPHVTANWLSGFDICPESLRAPDEQVKGYFTEEGFELAFSWLKANRHYLSGKIEYQGDEPEDRGAYYAHPDHGIEKVQDRIFNPGPSWEKTR